MVADSLAPAVMLDLGKAVSRNSASGRISHRTLARASVLQAQLQTLPCRTTTVRGSSRRAGSLLPAMHAVTRASPSGSALRCIPRASRNCVSMPKRAARLEMCSRAEDGLLDLISSCAAPLGHGADGTKCGSHWFHIGNLQSFATVALGGLPAGLPNAGWNRRRTVNIPSIGVRAGRRIIIEDIYPSVDEGRFAVKRIAGEPFDVWADIVRDGNAVLAAELLWRPGTTGKWLRTAMRPHGNDRWTASFTPPKPGRYEYAIEAWTDVFGTWRRDILAKRQAGLDVSLETLEGRRLLEGLRPRSTADARLLGELCRNADTGISLDELLADDIAAMAATDQQTDLTRSATFPLVADRPLARAGAWYEMVPRSQGTIAGPPRHLRRLHRASARYRRRSASTWSI